MKGSPDRRFDAKVQKGDGCWEWTASLIRGFGQFYSNPHRVHAHRYSYARTYGPIPVGLFVRHRCDNRKCVRPDHLVLSNKRPRKAVA